MPGISGYIGNINESFDNILNEYKVTNLVEIKDIYTDPNIKIGQVSLKKLNFKKFKMTILLFL